MVAKLVLVVIITLQYIPGIKTAFYFSNMNDIVKNTELFVNILGMSRTSAVQKWDREAFQRAFRWAHYFEQVSYLYVSEV